MDEFDGESESSRRAMVRCCQCKRKFDNLNLHLDLAHSNKREKWCEHCGRLFSKKSHFKKHLNTNQCDGSGHRCYVCDKNFNCVDSFSCHIEAHDSLHVYACKDCNRTFMLRNNYNEHVSLVHDNMVVSVDELLKDAIDCTLSGEDSAKFLSSIDGFEDYCIQCHRCFPLIKIHRSLVHRNKPEIVCQLCGRQFLKVKHLESHSTEHRRNTIECHVCKKNDFVDAKAFGKHLEEHESLRVLPCSSCSKVFALKINLDKHLRRKHKDSQQVDFESENTVSNLVGADRIQEPYLPENSLCRIHFVDDTNPQEYSSSPKKKNKTKTEGRENIFTSDICDRKDDVSVYPSLSCDVKEEPCYLGERHTSIREDKKKRLHREISSSPIRKRKDSSLSLVKEDEDPYQSCERSGKEESLIQTKKKKKNSDKGNLLSPIIQSSENVLSLLGNDKEESLIQTKKKKKISDLNLLSPINQSSENVSSLLGNDKEESLIQTKKKKKNSDKVNLLSPINQSSENVSSLFESEKEESSSIVRNKKRSRSDKENSLSPSKKSSNSVKHLLETDEEESFTQTKKKKKKNDKESLLSPVNQSSDNVISLLESGKEKSLSLVKNKSDIEIEKYPSVISSLINDSDNASSLLRKNKRKNGGKGVCSSVERKTKEQNEESPLILKNKKGIFDENSQSVKKGGEKVVKLKDSSNLGDKTRKSSRLKEFKNEGGANERNSRASQIYDSENEADCLSDTSQSSIVDRTCFSCGINFRNKCEVHSHYVADHNYLSMSCGTCGKVLKTNFNVYCHALKHNNAYPWKCKRCDVSLKTKTYYRRHMLRVHARNKNYKCPHCDEAFVYQLAFKAHVSLHLDETKFDCSFCGQLFRYKKLIRPHQEKIDCNECEISFPCKTLFEEHLNDKHSYTSLFDCPHCEKQYNMRNVLRRHITNKHFDLINKDPVYCQYCDYHTHSKYNLNRHVKNNHK